MKTVLFSHIATSDYLADLQVEADKYDGLYVDMANKEQRAYVKDKATLIAGLLKKVDRARIDLSRDFKQAVEKEAAEIRDRLETANKPFTLLIDTWTEERKKILAEKKAIEDAAVLKVQIEIDHESALGMERLIILEAAESERLKKEHDEKIRQQEEYRLKIQHDKAIEDEHLKAEAQALSVKIAADRAEKRAKDQIEKAERAAKEATEKAEREAEAKAERVERERVAVETDKINAQRAREANIEHKRTINRETLDSMIGNGVVPEDAQAIIKLIAQGKIANVTINY